MFSRPLSRQLLGDVVSLYAVQGLNYLMPIIVLPFLLRALGPTAYGSVVFAQSLMGFAVILIEFGFNFTAARDISVASADLHRVARIYWTTLAAKLLLLLASCIIVLGIMLFPRFRNDWPVFAASSLLLLGNIAFPQWYFQGIGRLRDVAIVQAISRGVISGCVIVAVHTPQDAWIAALILSAPQLVGAFATVCLGKALAPSIFYRPSFLDIKQALSQSWHLFAASASTTLYQNVNPIVLGLMCGERAVAFYSVSTRLITALQGLAAPITYSVFPYASRLFAENRQHAWKFLVRILRILLPAFAIAGVLVGSFAPLIVELIAGHEYSDAASVLRIMAALPLLITIAVFLSRIVMVNVGLTHYLPRLYLAVGALNLVLLPLLIQAFAEDGAAWSLLVAEALGPALMFWAIWRNRRQVGLAVGGGQ